MRLIHLSKTLALGALGVALATNLASAQCPAADALEPNDDCLSAVALANGTYTTLTVEGTGGVVNEDFYSVNLPVGEILTVDCLFSNASGDVDVYFYDPATSPNCGGEVLGDYLVRGFTASDNENVSYSNPTAAAMTIIVRVELFSAVACNDYDLVISTAPDPCVAAIDDGLEDNDSCGAAVALGAGAHSGLFTSNADEDYYLVSVPADEILTIDTFYSGVTDVDLELFDDLACTNQVDFSFSFGGTGQVTWTNGTGLAATVVLRAAPDAATGSCNNYDLSIVTVPDPCAAAIDDGLEQNDSCAAAVALASGLTTGLFTSVTDEDYYLINVPAGDALTVDETYVGTTDVDMDLFDDLACTNFVAGAAGVGGAGQVAWTNSTGAAVTMVLRVYPWATSGNCNNYDLNVTLVPDPCQNPLADDVLEDNDDCANAVPMVDGLTTNLFVSKADEDFFEVTVADLDALTVNMYAPVVPGDIDIYLYDTLATCGDLTSYLVRGYTSTDDESITWTNTTGSTQTYYIQVVVWANSVGDCNNYDLEIIGSGGSFATPMCFGDGSGTACPCANESVLGAGEGCKSSLGVGAILTASGSASVAADDITFTVTQARANQPSMLVQGESLIAVPFKDGVLCMGNPTERVEVVFTDANGEGTTATSIVTNGNVSPGDTRYYQQWFRDPGGVSPCGNGSNFSNGLMVIYN